MKTAKSISSTSNLHHQSQASPPFFQKKGEGSIVQMERETSHGLGSKSSDTENNIPFFNKASTPFVQAKPASPAGRLTIGQPGDKYEQEADSVADQVVQRLAVGDGQVASNSDSPTVQAKCAACDEKEKVNKKEEQVEIQETDAEVQGKEIFESNEENTPADVHAKMDSPPVTEAAADHSETPVQQTKAISTVPAIQLQSEPEQEDLAGEEEMVQMKHIFDSAADPPEKEEQNAVPQVQQKSDDASPDPSPKLESSLSNRKGNGSPLPEDTRSSMEGAFGTDFAAVRVHTDNSAVQMSKDLSAEAFTHGKDIYFNQGKYEPESSDGQRLLAHELTHTMQQGATVQKKEVQPVGQRISHTGKQKVQRWWNPIKAAKRLGRRVVGGVKSGIKAIGRGIKYVGEKAKELGRKALIALVRKVSPNFAKIIEKDGIRKFLKELVSKGFKALFKATVGRVKEVLNFGNIGAWISSIASSLRGTVAGLWKGGVGALRSGASKIMDLIDGSLAPAIKKIRDVAGKVREFFLGILESLGITRVMEFLKQLGEDLWQGLVKFIEKVGMIFKKIKDSIGMAWKKIKKWFSIGADSGTSEGGGLWKWIKGKAVKVWNWAKGKINVVMGPLKSIGKTLFMLSPLGAPIALFQNWPKIKKGFTWVRKRWKEANVVVRSRNYLNNTLMPIFHGGLRMIGNGMFKASTWLSGILGRVVSGAEIAQAKTQSSIILRPFSPVFTFFLGKFRNLVNWVNTGVKFATTHARVFFDRLLEFLKAIWDLIKKIIAIVVNPFGIPGLLLGNIWKVIPRKIKEVVIDFILTVLFKFIKIIPSFLPGIGPLWAFVKNAFLGFLEKMKSFAMERKVKASNKVANIISGSSTTFAFGYIKGLGLGIWEGIIGPIMMITDLFELPTLIRNFVNALSERFSEIVEEAKELLKSIVGKAMGTVDSVIQSAKDLLSDPMRLISIIKGAIDAALGAVQEVGAKFAEWVMSSLEQPDEKIGETLGNFTGQVLVEVVLTIVTAGGAAAGTAVKSVAKVLRTVAKNFMKVIRGILKIMPKVIKFVKKIGKLFRKAKSGASKMFKKIEDFINKVINWFKNALKKMKGGKGKAKGPKRKPKPKKKKKKKGDDDPSWIRIKSAIGRAVAPYERKGATMAQLNKALTGVKSRYVKSRIKVSSDGLATSPKWEVKARHPKLKIRREAADVFKDKNTRWRLGKAAVKKRLLRLKDRQRNVMSLNKILSKFKLKYGYTMLRAVEDKKENDFNIMASMSPVQKLGKVSNHPAERMVRKTSHPMVQKVDTKNEEIAEVEKTDGLHSGSYTDPIPIHFYKRTQGAADYPSFISIIINGERESIPMYGNREVYHKGERYRYGVSLRNNMHRGKKIKLIPNSLRPTASQRSAKTKIFKKVLLEKGASPKRFIGKHIDHVKDVAFGGSNTHSNLWPLDGDINSGRLWRNAVRTPYTIQYKDKVNGKWQKKQDNMFSEAFITKGKWFKIIGFKWPPPLPGGRDKNFKK